MPASAPSARLRILEGPNSGEVFTVVGRTRVGRGTGNEARLNHPSVSRDHLVLEPAGAGFRASDSGSLSGTQLNDSPLAEPAELHHGDVLDVGVFRLVFEQTAPEPLPADPPETNEVQATVPIEAAAETGGDVVAAVLYRLSESLLTEPDPDLLMDRFLAEVLGALPGDSAAVVRSEPLTGRLEVRRRRDRVPDPAGQARISRTLIQRCIEERRALLVDNVEGHPSLGDQTSVQKHQIRSVMCAPLPGRGKNAVPLGAVCLVSRRFTAGFNEKALRLLTTMSNLASLALAGALEQHRLKTENAALRGTPAISRLLTTDRKLKEIIGSALKVAVLPTTVLLTGETGTGKELIASLLHENSLRCNGPLVKVNCAAISESLLESELFGHEKGAFTDARQRRIGKIEAAHGGTLFLDEIGEMSLKVQAKLLRAVEQREFERVGGNDAVHVDVRFVAATHRNLAEMAARGEFREDLLYRLNVMPLHLPPLRDRIADIPVLAEHFAREFAGGAGTAAPKFGDQALLRLQSYGWPGNVRELRNVIERLCILHPGRNLTADNVVECLGSSIPAGPHSQSVLPVPAGMYRGSDEATEKVSLAEARAHFENEMIKRVLNQTGGNVTEAARKLGMTREALSRRIHKQDPVK
jgi:transcriptional regulator with GAF, ATPase, and Fis domain